MRYIPIERPWFARICILAIVCALTLWLDLSQREPRLLKEFDHSIRDGLIRLRSEERPVEDITIVDIDEPSLKEIGAWPWSRAQLATLVEELLQFHAVSIVALDIVLPEPSDSSGDQRLLALALERRLVLSQVLDYAYRDRQVDSGTLAGGRQQRQFSNPTATGFLGNHAMFASAPCVGNIGFIPDEDGTLRRLALFTSFQGKEYPALALSILECLGSPSRAPAQPPHQLRYAHANDSWMILPARELLNPTGPLPRLSNNIVLIGSSALGLSDQVPTPLGGRTAGYLVHANLLSELRHPVAGPPEGARIILILAQFAMLLSLMLAISTSRRWRSALWVAGLLSIALLMWVWLESSWEVSLSPSALILSLIALLIFQGGLEWAREWAVGKGRLDMLRRFVPDDVLQALIAKRSFDALKPRQAQITVLVIDTVNYSETIRTLGLERSTIFTQQLLKKMSEPIFKLGGTLDRYTGDGLVAFWGAPLDQPNAPYLALTAAKRAQEVLRNELSVELRCGIATGSALVGDVGSEFRSHYTAVGNCINLAARLEAMCKTLGISILMDRVTAEACGEPCHHIETLEVRGVGLVDLYSTSTQ